MKQKNFSVTERLKSFQYAFNGLKILIIEEHNARIHLFAAICVLIAGTILKLSSAEWITITFAIGLVIALQAINSAIENIADFISPEQNPQIKKIKDLSAASVLIVAISSCTVG